MSIVAYTCFFMQVTATITLTILAIYSYDYTPFYVAATILNCGSFLLCEIAMFWAIFITDVTLKLSTKILNDGSIVLMGLDYAQ